MKQSGAASHSDMVEQEGKKFACQGVLQLDLLYTENCYFTKTIGGSRNRTHVL